MYLKLYDTCFTSNMKNIDCNGLTPEEPGPKPLQLLLRRYFQYQPHSPSSRALISKLLILTLTFTTLLLLPFVSCNNEFDGYYKSTFKSNRDFHKNDVSSNKFHEAAEAGNNFQTSNRFKGGQQQRHNGPQLNNNNNELNSVPAAAAANLEDVGSYDDEILDDEYESYEDDSANSNTNWATDFESNDINEIVNFDKTEHQKHPKPKIKPVMAKCCPTGEGLTAQGFCKSHHSHHNQHLQKTGAASAGKYQQPQQYNGYGGPPLEHTSWFPQKIFHIEQGNLTVPDVNDWDIRLGHFITCPDNESSELISDTNKFAITNHGTLFVLHRDNKEVDGLDFCVDLLLGEGKPAVRSCFTKTELCGSRKLPCLRKCCPEEALVQEPSGECILSPTAHKKLVNFPKDKYNIVHGSPTCKFGQYVKDIPGQFSIDSDATFISSFVNLTFDNYCLDYFLESSKFREIARGSGGSGGNNELDTSSNNRKSDKDNNVEKGVLKVLVCFDDYDKNQHAIQLRQAGLIIIDRSISITYGVVLIISVICLLLAGIISWRLPELHSLHGKCQLCHLATLFFLFLILAIVHLASEELSSGLCTSFALLIHILALSAFLWLNLLCVNIYLTFRSLRPPLAARRGENRRLIFLCIYAWGIPAAFCAFLYILETFEPERFEQIPAPEYGKLICLISNRNAQFAYLFGPVGVLLLLNGILFCLTAKELLFGLWRLDNSDSINFRRKSMGIVVGKLGVVMGMGWILDVLSWGVGGPNFPYLFYVSDFFNALQGVFIFLVLIWRKRVLEMLHLRKPSLIKDDTLTGRPFLQNK